MAFVVEGLSNFHGGEGTVRRIGEYESVEAAVAASKRVIDDFLQEKFSDGTTAAVLFSHFQKSGEVPFIFRDDGSTLNVRGFNHFEYAMSRCSAMCAEAVSS
jgi:hypothetical protein